MIPINFNYLGKLHYIGLATCPNTEENAVIVSGRSYRVLGNDFDMNIIRKRLTSSSNNYTTFEALSTALEHSPVMSAEFEAYVAKAPRINADISESGKENLLNNLESDEKRSIAIQAFDQIHCVSFSEFLLSLEASVKKLNQYIKSEPFVLLYDPPLLKSGIWTTKLAFPYLESNGLKPQRIESWSWFDWFDRLPLQENQSIKHIVIIDDASYSGMQMKRAIKGLEAQGSLKRHFPNAQITIVIPYMTDEAIRLVKTTGVNIICQNIMQPFPPELKFQCNNDEFKGMFEGSTATYFEHKLASEGHSVVPLVKAGLLNPIVPPYTE